MKTKKSTTKTKLPAKLVKYLEKHGIKHEILEHKTVYTAFDAAATMNKKLSEIIYEDELDQILAN